MILNSSRVTLWYYSKIPVLLAVLYFLLLYYQIPATLQIYTILGLIAISSMGYAALGYIINDFFDREKDKQVGKSNLFLDYPTWMRGLFVLVILLICLSPFVWLPIDPFIYGFILLELVLFGLYSHPSIRIKEKSILGAFADGLYAHVVPSIIILLTISHYIDVDYRTNFDWVSLVAPMLTWQLVFGVRGILLHQLFDHENDTQSGTRSYAVTLGYDTLKRWVLYLVLPLDVLVFLITYLVSAKVYLAWIVLLAFILAKALIKNHRYLKNKHDDKTLRYVRNIVDNFYNEWLPLALLVTLIVAVSPAYGYLLAIHLLLFSQPLFKEIFTLLRRKLT